MRAPSEYRCLGVVAEPEPLAAYPGPGFFPIPYFQLGNGDVHGLYWPIDREREPPIVCELMHDEGRLTPHSGSLRGFLAHVRDMSDWEDGDDDFEDWLELCAEAGLDPESVAAHEDTRSPSGIYQRAREALAARDVEQAILHLERALHVLPEYGDASALLAAQYRRVGRVPDAVEAAIRSFASPPMFGGGVLLPWVATLEPDVAGQTSADPVFERRARIAKLPNGQKENETYAVMDECITAYLTRGDGPAAARLRLSWAQHLERETHSFRERYGWHDRAQRMAWLSDDLTRAELSRRLEAFTWGP